MDDGAQPQPRATTARTTKRSAPAPKQGTDDGLRRRTTSTRTAKAAAASTSAAMMPTASVLDDPLLPIDEGTPIEIPRIVPAELRAYRDTTDIQLSPRDLKVLRLLYDRRGKIVDRNMLADEVWGVDYFPESRALDQHISQLRKRIEKDPANPRIIRTVHGAGYRFE